MLFGETWAGWIRDIYGIKRTGLGNGFVNRMKFLVNLVLINGCLHDFITYQTEKHMANDRKLILDKSQRSPQGTSCGKEGAHNFNLVRYYYSDFILEPAVLMKKL